MRRLNRVLTLLAASMAILFMGADTPTQKIDADNVATFYRGFARLTKQPRHVVAAVSVLCTAPNATYNTNPHEGWIHIYANPAAEKKVAAGPKGPFPVGAVIVKEKVNGEGKVEGVGGMIKRAAGFDAENGDWEYFYSDRTAGFSIGKMTNCINCHAQAKDKDYAISVWASKK
jgi:hypothetical protein